MKKFVSALSFFLLLFVSCSQNKNVKNSEQVGVTTIDISKISPAVKANTKATEILKEWPEYIALGNSFNAVYDIKNEEDLLLLTDDVFEKLQLWEDSEFPEKFDIPQIKSRGKVLKTYILKLKAAQLDNTATEEPLAEVVEAYNAFKNQFNIVVNNTLDTKLILDE